MLHVASGLEFKRIAFLTGIKIACSDSELALIIGSGSELRILAWQFGLGSLGDHASGWLTAIKKDERETLALYVERFRMNLTEAAQRDGGYQWYEVSCVQRSYFTGRYEWIETVVWIIFSLIREVSRALNERTWLPWQESCSWQDPLRMAIR